MTPWEIAERLEAQADELLALLDEMGPFYATRTEQRLQAARRQLLVASSSLRLTSRAEQQDALPLR